MSEPLRVVQEQILFDRPVSAAANHTLRGVKVLGPESRNRNRYLPSAVAEAVRLYEGAIVNVDHPEKVSDDPKAPQPRRRLADRFGVLENVKLDPAGCLRGDLVCNPEHPLARQVIWFAQNRPHCLGLSHNALTQGKWLKEGVWEVNKIAAVHSVDLVANPATARSLYEGLGMPEEFNPTDNAGTTSAATASQPQARHWRDLLEEAVSALVRDTSPGAPDMAQRILKIIRPELAAEEEAEAIAAAAARVTRSDSDRLQVLEAELGLFKRKDTARRLLEENKIPHGEAFVEALARCPNEADMRSLLEERRRSLPDPALLKRQTPRSLPPGLPGGAGRQVSDEEFKRYLKYGF